MPSVFQKGRSEQRRVTQNKKALGQGVLAKSMGKKKNVSETAAGMHGVATVMAANAIGLKSRVYMGVKDIVRQKINAEKIKLLGGEVVPVTRGSGVLKD